MIYFFGKNKHGSIIPPTLIKRLYINKIYLLFLAKTCLTSDYINKATGSFTKQQGTRLFVIVNYFSEVYFYTTATITFWNYNLNNISHIPSTIYTCL